MNKFLKLLSSVFIMANLNCINTNAIKFEIFHKNFSFILDSKENTAKLYKVYNETDDVVSLNIPSFVEFCSEFYRVDGLMENCIDPYIFKKLNGINIPYTISKDENNRKIFFNLLKAPKLSNYDKLVIRDYFDDFFSKEIIEKQTSSALKRAASSYYYLNGSNSN